MSPALWSLMPLFTLITGLAGLAVAVGFWTIATKQMKTTHSEIESRLQLLAQRLLAIESRIDETGNQSRRVPDDQVKPARHAAPGESKKGHRTQSILDVREDKHGRIEPTLITIPDLGAGEEESEGAQAASWASGTAKPGRWRPRECRPRRSPVRRASRSARSK